MSVATITPTAPVTTKGKGKSAPAPVTDVATAAAALRKRYESADKGETAARARFDAAGIDWENTRVIKVRVAYAAAMLTPVPSGADKGKANLLAATRFLLLTDEERALPPAKVKALAVQRKSTLRNYVAAGEALQEAGLIAPDKITEPDANERKIVANVFREMNKRDKDETKGKGKGKGEGEGDSKGKGEGEGSNESDEPLTVTDLVGHIARMNKTLDLMAASGIVISEREASNIADMLAGFGSKLAEYAQDK